MKKANSAGGRNRQALHPQNSRSALVVCNAPFDIRSRVSIRRIRYHMTTSADLNKFCVMKGYSNSWFDGCDRRLHRFYDGDDGDDVDGRYAEIYILSSTSIVGSVGADRSDRLR